MVARWLLICMCIGGEAIPGMEKTISKGSVPVVAFGGRKEGARRGMNSMA